ncbi:EAL domain-containing protein [Neptuniibacter sp. SY11_33]|uniref:EAL domain-containing protein n=1 Tax=Neptuniibacter sp. SY11_33 TaxID=3398215 RepID=UPI0039F45D33
MIKRRLQQLIILGLLFLSIVIGYNSSLLQRVDLIAYDTLISQESDSPPENIVIIAIDDASLSQLGRWPWSRSIHADMLSQLTEANTSAVAFDILFAETDSPEADQDFARAIAQHGRVTLAMAPEKTDNPEGIKELLPIPTLAAPSDGIGHVDTEIDLDGISRRVYLYAGLGDPHWPTLGLALYQSSQEAQTDLPFKKSASPSGSGWLRQIPFLIPFYGPPGTIQRYSYIDVLNGTVALDKLSGKTVLVGATASGMGDAISTPVSGQHQRMPGVELNANIAASLMDKRFLFELTPTVHLIITLGLALTVLPFMYLLPRRYYPLSILFAIAVTVALTVTLFNELKLWFSPTDALALQALFFMFLSWKRYNASQRQITKLNKEVYQQLNFDPITHLPNREMIKCQLDTAIGEAQEGEIIAFLVIQLSGIKEVNNRLSISAGDSALNIAAQQIKTAVGFQYPVARLGGIEFAVMLPKQTDHSNAEQIGRRLLQLLRLPCQLEDQHFFFKPSIGISLYSQDGSECEPLINNAYTAMQKAKSNPKRELCFYSTSLKQQIIDESSLVADLHQALSQDQFEVYYQPQVLSLTGQVIGLEALLRWKHPTRGPISPAVFIPIAEKSGLIINIGEWVMETACRQAAAWNWQNDKPIRIAVNLSAVQFRDEQLIDKIERILQQTQLSPELLEVELTESALMDDHQETITTLTRLKEMGIQIAIDDFGTGYSSLSYLKQFPLDRIKIDQSFVRDLDESAESAEITQAIISMARSLKLQIIAEGVETQQQRGFLLTQTCEELQGFYFSKPLPSREISKLINQSLYLTPDDRSQKSD